MITIEGAKDLLANENFQRSFDEWWEADFSWDGLAKRTFSGDPQQTLADLVSNVTDVRIYFAGRDWPPTHLPPFDRDGNLSEKAASEYFSQGNRTSLEDALLDQCGSGSAENRLEGVVWTIPPEVFMKRPKNVYAFTNNIFMKPLKLPDTINAQFQNCIFCQDFEIVGNSWK